MPSLILALQQSCLNPSISTADILRMALVVARKLKIADLRSWIEQELNGYQERDQIPSYRVVKTSLEAWNPYNGWIPVMMEDTTKLEQLCTVPIGQSISDLEAISTDPEAMLQVPLSKQLEQQLMRGMDVGLRPLRRIHAVQAKSIVASVRTAVLNWSLKLEEDGIVGEGMTFSEQEKQVAAQSSTHIVHYHGPVGNSLVQQASNNSNQTLSVGLDTKAVQEFVQLLQQRSKELNLPNEELRQFSSDLQSVESQLISPRPNVAVIKECLKSVKNIIEGCCANVIAAALIHQFAPFLN